MMYLTKQSHLHLAPLVDELRWRGQYGTSPDAPPRAVRCCCMPTETSIGPLRMSRVTMNFPAILWAPWRSPRGVYLNS
jgi:hypothetical protein